MFRARHLFERGVFVIPGAELLLVELVVQSLVFADFEYLNLRSQFPQLLLKLLRLLQVLHTASPHLN